VSLPIDIADAVVAELNGPRPPGQEFSPAFTAVRAYRPQFELPDLKTLRVTVVPKAIEITGMARTVNQHDVSIDVAVQKKVAAADDAELDALMVLVERIADLFRLRRLSMFPTALWQRTLNVPIYSPEHLEQKQVFTSVLTLSFRVIR
jgi:hypothetical protein